MEASTRRSTAIPLAHYDYWKKEMPGRDLPMGSFGENFTIDGLLGGLGASG